MVQLRIAASGTAISNGNVQRVWDASQQVDACETR